MAAAVERLAGQHRVRSNGRPLADQDGQGL